ncbi:MAG: N-(5'-phosphoribosyl)anthranilate isomerase [Legionellales bacterium]|nr:N-(5'-phosphoribosyl)anthranilate isomerase [Legionellales bacterium]
MDAKICGVKDSNTLNYIINHKHFPKFIGFITNYPKSKRYIEYKNLKKLINIKKKGTNFVSVLVNPNEYILEKIKNLNFDYFQLYDVSPEKTKFIKEKYNKKIISALTIEKKTDVNMYKKYEAISDIILFDSKGYEKSAAFGHEMLNDVPNHINRMLAGNIQYNDNLDKYSKIADIIDISGSLETSGEKDISKINIFLNNINKFKNEN